MKFSRFQQAKKERRVNAFPKNYADPPALPSTEVSALWSAAQSYDNFFDLQNSIFLNTTRIYLVAMSLQHPRMRQPDAVTFQAPLAPGFPLITARAPTHYYPNFAKSRNETPPNLGTKLRQVSERNLAKPRNGIPPNLGIDKCMWLIRN